MTDEQLAGKEKLRQWVLGQRNCELAQARLVHGYESWVTAADEALTDEIAESVIEGIDGLTDTTDEEPDKNEPRLSPTLHELRVLAKAKKAASEVDDWPTTVELRRFTYQDDGEGYTPPRIQTELMIVVELWPSNTSVRTFAIVEPVPAELATIGRGRAEQLTPTARVPGVLPGLCPPHHQQPMSNTMHARKLKLKNHPVSLDHLIIIDLDTDNHDVVAEIPKTGDEEYDNAVVYANAEMFSAAPDMLAALQMVAACCGPADGWQGETHAFLVAVEKAIAKATGK